MNYRFAAAVVLLTALVPPRSSTAQVVSLRPENPTQWDLSFHVGWFGGNKSPDAPEWNDWYDAAGFAVSAGYYWTPNVKLEADVSTSTPGSITHDNPVFVSGLTYPYHRPREHHFRATQATAGLQYQFLENRWFHPFLGGGLALTYETERADGLLSGSWLPPGVALPPPLAPVARDRTAVNPFVTGGFKAYVSERAFIRGDVRGTFSSDRAEWVTWRAGIGVDL